MPQAKDRKAGLTDESNPAGSLWHRWDPHIHMPGTLKNDQFGTSAEADADYISRINAADPPIEALGITDYYVLDSYERALGWKKENKLPGVRLIFPNVELRFAVNAPKGSPINVHLLVCPDAEDLIDNLNDCLSNLEFTYKGERYGANKRGLIRLGHAFKPSCANDVEALKLGVAQHKVSADDLIALFQGSTWARRNILVAVAAGKNDGTSQLQDDSDLTAVRKKLERLADVMFSSNLKDRHFWLGKGLDSHEAYLEEYRCTKPCLHGSDAHTPEAVGKPKFDRRSWLKGDVTFETLRQACIEPDGRAFVGERPPAAASPSNTIVQLAVDGADWLDPATFPINPGLVAVIGARGSGKTAFVEMIAAAANAVDPERATGTFLSRAKRHLGGAAATLRWGGGPPTTSNLMLELMGSESSEPRARHLSQQFVDALCSSDGLADELVQEMERVIFLAHDPSSRYDASDFSELRDTMTASARRSKAGYIEALLEVCQQLSVERDLDRSGEQLRSKRKIQTDGIGRDKADRKILTPKTDQRLLERLEAIRTAVEGKSRAIARQQKRRLDLQGLQREADLFRGTNANLRVGKLKTQFPDAGLSEPDWKRFVLNYAGDIDGLLKANLKDAENRIAALQGPSENEIVEAADAAKAPEYVAQNTALTTVTLSLLQKEQRRLEALIGIDREQQRRYTVLSEKITKAETELAKTEAELEKAAGAPERIAALITQREACYRGVFEEIENEEHVLRELYQPLRDRLAERGATLRKLAFSVAREVNIESWAEAGERLLNLKRAGRFRGLGTLVEVAREELLPVWRKEPAAVIAESMSAFRKKYGAEFWKHIPEDANQSRETKKAWAEQIIAWLFSTDHIKTRYSLQYEGTDIRQLSPGTRGIVLLLLYLVIDSEDDRPLIIDQPEENLDPKSIHDELVGHFREAKGRRQIIIVTHNANLVVNTDADQVIVASRSEHRPDNLPVMTYESGGLENPNIRNLVCEILEGGETAFLERARRLRVTLPTL
jgi:ABC-type lipoprotein export system ATPase subunit